MADGRHLETVLIAISQQRFDGLPWNLVTWWRTLTLSSLSTIKISFLNEGKTPYLSNGLIDLHEIWHGDTHWFSQPQWTEQDVVCCTDSRAPKEPHISCTLAPSGEYDWTIRARIRV